MEKPSCSEYALSEMSFQMPVQWLLSLLPLCCCSSEPDHLKLCNEQMRSGAVGSHMLALGMRSGESMCCLLCPSKSLTDKLLICCLWILEESE